ncbi:MAG TPA: hypothetical protein VMF69_05785 [Gemmataceae bacterium]|nr:hypothetical protein [Gemmataceae bacterium]
MNLEPLLVYGLAAAGGWLLRHLGVGSGVKIPGLSPAAPAASTAAAASTASTAPLPVMTTLKADIDQIVKSAVESAVKQSIDDIKSAAVPQTPRQPS